MLNSYLWSQETVRDYHFVTIKEGISKAAPTAILQDHYGFIWIGTNGTGLHKYDGIDYTTYKYALNDTASLNSSLIYCTYLDVKKQLWIGTENGLNLYDRAFDRFKRIPIINRPENPNEENITLGSLTGDHKGNLFIGTFDRGLFKMKPESFDVSPVPVEDELETASITINSLKTAKRGKVYAGTDKGLKEYDPGTGTLRTSVFNTAQGTKSIAVPVQSLWIDSEDRIWVGSVADGLYTIENAKDGLQKIMHFPVTDKRILSLITLPDGTAMCGTENDGLIHLNASGRLIKNYLFDKTDKNSIRTNSIWVLFLDKNERIWMGYYNRGVGVYDKRYDKFKNIESLSGNPNSLTAGSVTGIVQDTRGRLWISMDGGGIDVYNPKTNTFIQSNAINTGIFSNLNALDIQTVFIDSRQNIWAGSWSSGLYVLKNGTKRFTNYTVANTQGTLSSNSILSFAEDADGTVWIGTFHSGVVSYDPDTKRFTAHNSAPFRDLGIHRSNVRKVLVDSNNNIWVGTTGGLYKIIKEGQNQFAVVSMTDKIVNAHQNPISASHILSIYESSGGVLWIGTRGSGLCAYDRNNDTLTWYNALHGLQEENVVAITESADGSIWISGNTGIYRLVVQTNTITHYTANDGLLSNDFNFNATLRDKEGAIYFGNYKGVDYFNPDEIEINTDLPSLHFTGFRLFNKKVLPNQKRSPLQKVISETNSIVLTHTQSVFTIEYSGINYTRPEKNQYAYYLEGLEESWNYVGNKRSATYTNLDQGNYIFKLKAANNDGVWNETPLTLEITILPPWWKTKWARISYGVLFFMGIYLSYKIIKNRIREKQLIRYEREKRTQEEALHEKKLQFFTNISHEFRTPLTLIINPLKTIINDNTLVLPDSIKEKHRVIHKNTDRLYRLINELMDFRKLESNKIKVKACALDMTTFVRDVAAYFNEEALQKNIQFTINYHTTRLDAWADPGMLEKIIFNLLSNAFKVTPEGGAITLQISLKTIKSNIPSIDPGNASGAFEIAISDTGPGLKKEQIANIFERFYQVDTLNKRYYEGTGVGLEVVRNFVALHRGEIKVDSTLHAGTTFRVIFPLGNAHFKPDEIVPAKPTGIKNPEVPVYGTVEKEDHNIAINPENPALHKLLIVEDHTELRNYLKKELSDQYKIATAPNGSEGLKVAGEETPDIIITDVIMPEMNGFDFCLQIKRNIKTSHIPLLMLTAKTMPKDRLQGIDAGADAYMAKPFDMNILKARLSQLLTSRQMLFNKYFSAISNTSINSNSTSLDKEFIQKVLNYINEKLSDPDLNVVALASQLNLSRSQFYRKVKTLTGQSANQFLRNIRLQRARQMLERRQASVSEVCYRVGFSSPSYFTKCFKTHFGILPTEIQAEES